jgi:hypothetical protein
MQIVIYSRKADEKTEKMVCLAELIRETKTHVEFRTQDWLPVALGLSYYVRGRIKTSHQRSNQNQPV